MCRNKLEHIPSTLSYQLILSQSSPLGQVIIWGPRRAKLRCVRKSSIKKKVYGHIFRDCPEMNVPWTNKKWINWHMNKLLPTGTMAISCTSTDSKMNQTDVLNLSSQCNVVKTSGHNFTLLFIFVKIWLTSFIGAINFIIQSVYSLVLQNFFLLYFANVLLPIWTSTQCNRKQEGSLPQSDGGSLDNWLTFGCVSCETKT